MEVLGIAVAIANPCDGAVFQEGTNLAVQAMAHFDFGTITQVDFYTNGSLLGSSSSSHYSVAWSNVRAGSWNLSATARTSTGLSGSSAVVNVMVLRDIRVALTEPSPGTVFPEGTNFTLCATAACPLTVISRVDFYDGGTWVGSADSSPYCIVRSNSPPGFRSLFAVATETEGLSATSAVVNVAVVPKQPIVAGTLYVDLRATNLLPQGSWVNQGALGDFSAQWPYPGLETNAAGTAFPGVSFNGNQWFVGPDTLPDIEGASDRSIEVWALEAAPLGTSEILVSSGALLYDSSFAASYGTDLAKGAFMQAWGANPGNAGWITMFNVPVPGVWHHLVYVYDGAAQLIIYVDGLPSVAKTLPYELSTWQTTPIVIGAATYSPAESYWGQFNGYINSVRVHGGVLSPGDVWVNYLMGPVQWQPMPVTLLTQPSDLVVPEQGGGILSVMPHGLGPFSFQWYRAGTPLAGATDSTYALSNAQWADNGAQFFCVVSPPYDCPSCTATSRTAIITVLPVLPVVQDCAAVAEKEMFGLLFSTVPGGNYQVEYKNSLAAPTWTPLGPAQTAASTSLTVADDCNFFTNQHRFYRVVRLP